MSSYVGGLLSAAQVIKGWSGQTENEYQVSTGHAAGEFFSHVLLIPEAGNGLNRV